MSESAIADFVTSFVPDTATHAEPVRGRVLLSNRRIVLATENDTTTIPLRGVFDVQHQTALGDLAEFLDDTITLGYEHDGDRRVAVIDGAGDAVERFVLLVFQGALHGATVYARHPARRAGRDTDQSFEAGALAVSPCTVEIRDDVGAELDISTITNFERVEREVGDTSRKLLSVRHLDETGPVTTELALDSGRRMNLLGRFIRLRYAHPERSLEDIDLSTEEIEMLLAIYSSGQHANGTTELGLDASPLESHLEALTEKGLVDEDADGYQLTPTGRAAVSEHIEEATL